VIVNNRISRAGRPSAEAVADEIGSLGGLALYGALPKLQPETSLQMPSGGSIPDGSRRTREFSRPGSDPVADPRQRTRRPISLAE